MLRISQHKKDLELLNKINLYFNNKGVISLDKNQTILRFWDKHFLIDHVLNHFDTYPLLGIKYLDYLDFKEGMLKWKKYFNSNYKRFNNISYEDKILLQSIANRMNSKRIINKFS